MMNQTKLLKGAEISNGINRKINVTIYWCCNDHVEATIVLSVDKKLVESESRVPMHPYDVFF